jgi:prolyl-tRNA synthetase
MGGTGSQEFMMESDAGEDVIALSEDSSYAANVEVATSTMPRAPRFPDNKPLEEIHTPNVKTIDQLAQFLKVDHGRLAKSVVYWGGDKPVLIMMMGNDALNESKLMSVLGAEVRPIEAEKLQQLTGADGGSIGPVGLKGFTILADKRLEGANGLVSGANRNDYHYGNIDLKRDCVIDGYHDLRTVQAGEPAPNGSGRLRIVKGIELGHIFKLGTKYSDALNAKFLDENGQSLPVVMGSYGIGIERILACHIEQNHDKDGIFWDKVLAPYQIHLIAVSTKSKEVVQAADALYETLGNDGVEVLYDDRSDISPGFKFKDADLLGMPFQVIVGEKNLAAGKIEIKTRKSGERQLVDRGSAVEALRTLLA